MVAGDLRQGLSRPALLVVVGAFCLPLFFGLARTDLENDEAIYSYAVESILDTGEWASPRSSPNPDIVFLEKPPLKFWIVAAPIRLGLLPANEFGLRFWDAVFGALAFLYVFLLGYQLSGAVCGFVALLVLFGHQPLLFSHGLRSNNMDAALVLAYCGGMFHYLRWAGGARRPAVHLGALAAWFYLGFMTKFVAALFLPAIIAFLLILLPEHRRQAWAARGGLALAVVAVLAGVLPWFVYAYIQHREALWNVMFAEHVVDRFTRSIDPTHVAPWHFYVSSTWGHLRESGSLPWVLWGGAVTAYDAGRRRRAEPLTLLAWFVVPLAAISLGTSKLYHYFYPFVPPLALMAGHGVARLVELGRERLAVRSSRPVPKWRRTVFGGLATLALGVALFTIVEPIHVELGRVTIFRNHSVGRPLLLAAVLALLAGWGRPAVAGAALLAVSLLVPTPLDGYFESIRLLGQSRQPLTRLASCIREVNDSRRAAGQPVQEPYAPVAEGFLHPYFYYLRGTGWYEEPVFDTLERALFRPGEPRVAVLDSADYVSLQRQVEAPDALPPVVTAHGIVVVLPGDYAGCRAAAGARGRLP